MVTLVQTRATEESAWAVSEVLGFCASSFPFAFLRGPAMALERSVFQALSLKEGYPAPFSCEDWVWNP